MPAPMLESSDINVIRDQFIAWMEGAVARASCSLVLSENPYPERSAKGDAWEHGWSKIDWELERMAIDRVWAEHAEKHGIIHNESRKP